MIIEFILSFMLLCITASVCSLTSGGLIWELVDYALLPGILLILVMMIVLSGYGKSFVTIFQSAKKIKSTSLAELKKTEAALDYAFKALCLICVFFILISAIYFYLNFEETQTLGINLATVLLAFFYLSFFGMIFITLKSKLKKNIIKFMEEETPAENDKASISGKAIALRIVKIFVSLAFIIALYFLITCISTVNHTGENPLYYLRDLPGLIYIFIPPFLMLTISGNFKNFFRALNFVIKNQKLTVSQKALSINAISSLRMILLLEGIMATLCGFIGMLFNLEDRSMLGICFTIACVPMVYALLINLILLPVESKVSLLCDLE